MSELLIVLKEKIKYSIEKDIFYKEIGALIKESREDTKLTQDDLAEILDVKRNKISRIERGAANIQAYDLYLICHILNISDTELMKSIQRKQRQAKVKKGKYESEFYQLLETTKLTESLYRYLIQTITLISGGKKE